MNPLAVKNLHVRTVAADVLVHDVDRNMVHVLNDSAGTVLRLCDGSRTIDEIVRDFGETRCVDFAVLDAEVRTVLAKFEEIGIVTPGSVDRTQRS